MDLAETALLLGFAAAFDRRTVGEADVRAWQMVLTDITPDEARAAVAAHYAERRDWIMPSDIRHHVRAQRATALNDFQYEPGDPDETPEQYLARRRQQLHAVATGRRPAALALPPGRQLGDTSAIGQLPAAPAPVRRPGPFGVPCPHCKAPAGQPCKTSVLGRRMADAHPSRLDASRSA